jgi:HPt (histidine-containing phosphotransfer) domain-containing protein
MERTTTPTHDNARLQSVWTLPEELLQLAQDGGADVVIDVITVFQEDTASRLELLQAAVRKGDCAAIRAEGHALKGSSSQLGAAAMARMCFQMEQMGSSGNIGEAAGLLVQIKQNFAEVSQAMSSLNLGDGSYAG